MIDSIQTSIKKSILTDFGKNSGNCKEKLATLLDYKLIRQTQLFESSGKSV